MGVREVDRKAVERVLVEADELGCLAFLEKYGFWAATTYLLRYDSHFYDPKAVIGSAHQFVDGGAALAPADFDADEIAFLEGSVTPIE